MSMARATQFDDRPEGLYIRHQDSYPVRMQNAKGRIQQLEDTLEFIEEMRTISINWEIRSRIAQAINDSYIRIVPQRQYLRLKNAGYGYLPNLLTTWAIDQHQIPVPNEIDEEQYRGRIFSLRRQHLFDDVAPIWNAIPPAARRLMILMWIKRDSSRSSIAHPIPSVTQAHALLQLDNLTTAEIALAECVISAGVSKQGDRLFSDDADSSNRFKILYFLWMLHTPLSWAPDLRLKFLLKEWCQLKILKINTFVVIRNLALGKSNLDFYQVLAVPRHVSSDDIKAAYHRALLTFHPDKQRPQHRHGLEAAVREVEVSIPLIREAYATLSHPESRKQYDIALLHAASHGFDGKPGSRPAQVVSLEEFVVERPDQDEKPDSNGSEDQQDGWASETYTYPCRCGGNYKLTTEDLENGHHLVGCECCSEVIWVGYEEIIEDGEDIR